MGHFSGLLRPMPPALPDTTFHLPYKRVGELRDTMMLPTCSHEHIGDSAKRSHRVFVVVVVVVEFVTIGIYLALTSFVYGSFHLP